MNKFFVFLMLILILFTTMIIALKHPKTHKPIVFENKTFNIELITNKISMEENIPQIENKQKENIQNTEINKSNNVIIKENNKKIQTTKINPPQNKNTNSIYKNTSSNIQTASKNIENNKTLKHQSEVNSTKNTDSVQHSSKEKNISIPPANPVQKEQQKDSTEIQKNITKPINSPKILTEEEEIIAWNKWRSDLQNKLMKDSKISAPIGTSFEFSFTVDKFGTITNLKTWSSNPSYTPLAVKVIKPLLLSYQKTYILNFPTGSKRVITNVKGGFTMAHSSRYSSPSDYNDYERVSK
jgi:hypothetical protein